MGWLEARSMLFVPGTRPDRFVKARNAGADLICIDLEDATASTAKELARNQSLEFLRQQSAPCHWLVRINSLRSAAGLADVLELHAAGLKVGVALAKVESAAELQIAQSVLGPDIALLAVLESALGIERAFEIAAVPACAGLMLGAADYCAEIGAQLHAQSLAYPRARLLAAAGSRGLASMDAPYFEIIDERALLEEARHSNALGFSGKAAIHPRQIATIHAAMLPSDADIAHAQALIRAYAQSAEAAMAFRGKMIDRPIVLAAQRILARAGQRSTLEN